MSSITITIGDCKLHATLRNTATALSIFTALPIQSSAQTWGEEVYFSIPISSDLEDDAKEVINKGELAFWVEGNCIAIGFGPTPISEGNEIRLAAKTNIWADAKNDVGILRKVKPGDDVHIAAAT